MCRKIRGERAKAEGDFLSCGLIYGYWEHKSFTSTLTSSTVICSLEYIFENKLRKKVYLCRFQLDSRNMLIQKFKTNTKVAKVMFPLYSPSHQPSNIYMKSVLETHCKQ